MQQQSDPKSTDEKLRNQPPRIPKPNESRNNNVVADPPPMFVENNSIHITNGDEQEIEMNLPLLSSQLQSTTFFLTPPETRTATINLDKAIEYELKHGRKLDPKMDRKKLRRTVSNRLSAQRSRQRKAHYIHDMERKANELEVTLIFLEEKLARLLEKRRLLKLQNEALEQLLVLRQHQANQAQMVLEKNKAELKRLKEVHKALLKMSLEGGWSSSSCSGLIYEDEEQVENEGDVGMDEDEDPFLNFDD